MKGRLILAIVMMAVFFLSCENKHEDIRKEMNRIAQTSAEVP